MDSIEGEPRSQGSTQLLSLAVLRRRPGRVSHVIRAAGFR